MAAWTLTRGMQTVRAEFDAVWPGRDKGSDGSIGDQAHAVGTSGHNPDITGKAEYKDGDSLNEVRAIDTDRDLVPGSAVDWMELVVQYLVKRARAGTYVPFRYFIYKSRIWHRSDGWQTRVYTGANSHNEHLHVSGDYTQKADEWTGSLGLAAVGGEGDDMLVKKGDDSQEVAFWQYVLSDLGFYKAAVDTTYGPAMEAAVNAFRASRGVTSKVTSITGWQGWAMLAAVMDKRAGKPGKDGRDGNDGLNGEDGKDGTLTGVLAIQGVVSATAQQGD